MKKFLLEVTSPYRAVFSECVDMITVPTPNGRIGILADHMNMSTVLVDGEMIITVGKEKYFLAIYGGFLQISENTVKILVFRALFGREVNELEVKNAVAHATAMVRAASDQKERLYAQTLLRRSFLCRQAHEHFCSYYKRIEFT